MCLCCALGNGLNAGLLMMAEENRSRLCVLEGIILAPHQTEKQNKPRAGSCWVMDAPAAECPGLCSSALRSVKKCFCSLDALFSPECDFG